MLLHAPYFSVMFSKLFGSRSKDVKQNEKHETSSLPLAGDLSFLVTDIHSHFIPGIDDGAQTIQDSVALVRTMKELGYKNIVTTPHIKYDHYPNTRETILGGLEELHRALDTLDIKMPIKAAAEYYIDDHFMHLLETEPLLTVRDNEVLVEISFMFEPVRFNDILFKIQTAGYKPILAHPERYTFYHDKMDMYQQLKDRGCYLQMNTIALSGYYGKSIKHVAESLLNDGLYDYCGTDMHHLRHAESLKKVMSDHKILHKLQKYPFRNSKIQFQ